MWRTLTSELRRVVSEFMQFNYNTYARARARAHVPRVLDKNTNRVNISIEASFRSALHSSGDADIIYNAPFDTLHFERNPLL